MECNGLTPHVLVSYDEIDMSATSVSRFFSAVLVLLLLHFTTLSVYAQVPPPSPVVIPTIIGNWSFSEGSGTTTVDSIGGHNGTLKNGVVWKSGAECFSGKCVFFDGVNDFIDVGNFDVFNLLADEKFLLIVHARTALSNKDMVIVSKSNSTPLISSTPGWALLFTGYYADSTGLRKTRPFFFSLDPSGNYGDSETAHTTAYSNNAWHTFEIELNNETFKSTFTADGVVAAQLGSANYLKPRPLAISNAFQMIFGASKNGTADFYKGYLDEISLYKTKIVHAPSPTPIPSSIPTPTPTPSPITIPTATPQPPLMCIAANCTSNTNPIKYGSNVSCSVTTVSGTNISYEGECSLLRNNQNIQTLTLTPTLSGSPIFQPFTVSHANVQLSCVFRVCKLTSSVQTCSAWGTP